MQQQATKTLVDSSEVQAIAQPLRMAALKALVEPRSAAAVAREVGIGRQRMNYHIKALERTGLVKRIGERRNGNFVEQLYQAVARRFKVAHELVRDKESLTRALKDQVALGQLANLGSRLQEDAIALLDVAEGSAAQIPSATVEAELKFVNEEARQAFLQDYLALVKKHSSSTGEQYHVALAAYPDELEQNEETA